MKDAAARIYERVLILRCQAGDETALGEVIARYSPGVRLFLAKMTGRPELLDDLLQETWFEVYRKLNRLRRPEAFTAWLYRIARNKALSVLRRKSGWFASFDERLTESAPAAEQDFSAEDAESVRAALDELPGEPREVLLLRYIEDLSYEEISEVLGCSVGTVKSRLFYARQALREKLRLKQIREELPR